MQTAAPCPEWDYEKYPGYSETIRPRIEGLLRALINGSIAAEDTVPDTRTAHGTIFQGLTPPNHEYFAGNYRGSAFNCLADYRVCVRGDSRVGTEPRLVAEEMERLKQAVLAGFEFLSENKQLILIVAFACQVFETFLRIHPYANGNGHTARLIVWAILSHYGYRPTAFTVEPRPPDPPYTPAITLHRDGDRQYLIAYVLACLDNRYSPTS